MENLAKVMKLLVQVRNLAGTAKYELGGGMESRAAETLNQLDKVYSELRDEVLRFPVESQEGAQNVQKEEETEGA